MTAKSRIKKAEDRLGGQGYEPLRIIWEDVENSSPEDVLYEEDGRPITRAEYDQLVKEGKIRVITWPEDDREP